MKRAFIFLFLITCNSYILTDSDDKIVDAIEDSDPETLRDLLIPGFLITVDAKEKYVKLAQEATNQTHSQLHQYHFSDLGSCIKGFLYGGLGACFAYLGVDYLARNRDWRRFIIGAGNFEFRYRDAAPAPDAELQERDRHILTGCLLALGTYFSCKSLGIFNTVLTKQERLKKHYKALTIEAIMQRLPAFDNGCFVPGSLN